MLAVVVVVIVAVVVATVAVFGAVPAAAHSVLEESDPPAGSQLVDAPERVWLRFSGPIEVGEGAGRAIRVYDRRGEPVAADEPRVEGTTVSAGLPSLPDGAYVVTWHVISADGHPQRGAFTFAVGDADPDDVAGLAERLLARAGGSIAVGAAFAAVRAVLFGALIVLVGGAVLLRWAPSASTEAGRRLLWAAWGLSLAATPLELGLLGADAAGGGFADALRSAVIGDALDTRPGRAAVVRLLLLLPAAWWLRRRAACDARVAPRLVGLVLATGLLVSAVPSGHALSGDQAVLGALAAAGHVSALAVWLGGLAVLLAGAVSATRDGPADGPDASGAATLPERFPQVAAACVAVLLATGVLQGRRQVRTLDDLSGTDYGRLLIVKVMLFAAILLAASASRDIVRRQVRGLRASIAVEVAVAAAVLVLSAVLVHVQPPAEERFQPFSGTLRSEQVWFDVEVLPAQTGPNDVHVTARNPGGGGRDVLELSVWLSEPTRDIAPIEVEVRRLGPGHFVAAGAEIPFPGDWRLEVRALVGEDHEVLASGGVPIGQSVSG